MPKLKLAVAQWGNVLFCQVQEQHELLRGKDDIYDVDGFTVTSEHAPSLGIKSLHLRGASRWADDMPFGLAYGNAEEAAAIVDRIRKAVHAINDSPCNRTVPIDSITLEVME